MDAPLVLVYRRARADAEPAVELLKGTKTKVTMARNQVHKDRQFRFRLRQWRPRVALQMVGGEEILGLMQVCLI